MFLAKNNKFFQIIFLFVIFQFVIVFLFFIFNHYSSELLVIMLYKHVEIFIFIFVIFVLYDSNINMVNIIFFSTLFKFLYGVFHYNIFYYFQGYPMSMGRGFDEYTYYIFAKNFAPFVLEKSIIYMSEYVNFPVNYMGYPYLLSFFIRIFGENNYYHLIINPILSTLSGVIFYKFFINITNFPKKMLKLWLLIYLFFPSISYFSVLNLKDSLLLLFLSISFFSVSKILLSNNIIIKVLYLLILFIISYCIFFIRAPFVILPIILLFIHLSIKRKYIIFLGAISIIFINLFFANILMFFRWEYIVLVFSKYKKWLIMKKYPFLIFLLILLSPFLILLPMPILYPLPSSIGTNISTEIFKIPINIEYSIIFLILFASIFSKKNIISEFKFLSGKFNYFQFTIIIFIILVVSNYITYERHRLLFEVLLYLPFSYILYSKIRINIKVLFVSMLLLENFVLYFTYIRGSLKGVF